MTILADAPPCEESPCQSARGNTEGGREQGSDLGLLASSTLFQPSVRVFNKAPANSLAVRRNPGFTTVLFSLSLLFSLSEVPLLKPKKKGREEWGQAQGQRESRKRG